MRTRPITACLAPALLLGAGLLWTATVARADEPAAAIAPDTGPAIVVPETGAPPKIVVEPTLPPPPETLPPPASAKTATDKTATDDKDATPRYRFSVSGEGFVRLDSQTGEVSYCAPRTAGWACQPAADERAALEAEIARLADANVALKRDLAAHQPPASMPTPMPDAAPPKGYRVPEGEFRLPTNEDIDRAVTFAGKVWKRLVDMLNDIQKDAREKI